MTLRASFAQALSALATTRHLRTMIIDRYQKNTAASRL
jgi:hypothetical protein